MPKHQHLLGLWMLATSLLFFAGLLWALWLDAHLGEAASSLRWGMWGMAFLPALLVFGLGLGLQRRLFGPLRRLQVLMARWSAHPDAATDYPPEGWLYPLAPDMQRIRSGWQQDRISLKNARLEGAKQAARIRLELEAVIQVLQVPLLLYDQHQRLLLFNPAAEVFFAQHPGLGLGRQLQTLLPCPSLQDALRHLPKDGSPRQLLIPDHSTLAHQGTLNQRGDLKQGGDLKQQGREQGASQQARTSAQQRWYVCDLRRVLASRGELLITIEEATEQQDEQRWRQPLMSLLPALRGHAANLTTAVEVMVSDPRAMQANPHLGQRLQQGIHQDSQALSQSIQALGQVFEKLSQSRLRETWSNDVWAALCPGLVQQGIHLTPIGIPLWFKADTPSLLILLNQLLGLLRIEVDQTDFEVEMQLGNQRVYMDLIWVGQPLSLQQLDAWAVLPVEDHPLAMRLADLLRRHASDWWSLVDPQQPDRARLRLPLPSATRVYPPQPLQAPRPEFHDFSIADLPAPNQDLALCALDQLDLLVFDTETTGLEITRQDRIISIGACRIVNGRLLAQDYFDQKVNPERPIPLESTRIHGLTDADVAQSPPIALVLPRFHAYVADAVLVAHNAAFDVLALQQASQGTALKWTRPVLDTLLLSRALDPELDGHGLDALAVRFGLIFPEGTRHTALGDARVTAELFLLLLPRLQARGVLTLADALAFQQQASPVLVDVKPSTTRDADF